MYAGKYCEVYSKFCCLNISPVSTCCLYLFNINYRGSTMKTSRYKNVISCWLLIKAGTNILVYSNADVSTFVFPSVSPCRTKKLLCEWIQKNWIILQGARGKHDWATGSDITSGQQQAGIVYSGYVSQSVIGWQISHYEKKVYCS